MVTIRDGNQAFQFDHHDISARRPETLGLPLASHLPAPDSGPWTALNRPVLGPGIFTVTVPP